MSVHVCYEIPITRSRAASDMLGLGGRRGEPDERHSISISKLQKHHRIEKHSACIDVRARASSHLTFTFVIYRVRGSPSAWTKLSSRRLLVSQLVTPKSGAANIKWEKEASRMTRATIGSEMPMTRYRG